LDELVTAANLFMQKKINQNKLDTAQFVFDRARSRVKLNKKHEDEQNVKTPWAPIVKSTSGTTTSVSSAIFGLHKSIKNTETNAEIRHEEMMGALHEIRDVSYLRQTSPSYSPANPWLGHFGYSETPPSSTIFFWF
jgi:hypothetical protein